MIQINLPDEDAIRRQAGRALVALAERIQRETIPPISDEDIVAEVRAVRASARVKGEALS